MSAGQIFTHEEITAAVEVSCDVCIVGSGAGGSVLAAGLVERGLSVVMLEAGPYVTRRDFDLDEAQAFSGLYQGRGTRATKDLAITVLQGRTVGGSTTVNWTTCYRLPERIIEDWRARFGFELGRSDLDPHFDAVEQRLSIGEWPEAVANANNRKLLDGARALGWEAKSTRRNVRGCANSGYCGVGCPVDGKQAMHVTYLPDALRGGLQLYANTRVERFEIEGGRVVAVRGRVIRPDTSVADGPEVVVRPKVAVSSAGALNGPMLLMRSGLNEGPVGKRTYLHPVVAVAGEYAEPVMPFYGAPQSAASHQFIERGDDKVGFFLEVPPLQPMLGAVSHLSFGTALESFMSRLPHLGLLIALSVDGRVPGDEGGTVRIGSDGRMVLDYPITPLLAESFRASHEAMARIALSAGAERVVTLHREPIQLRTEADLARLASAPYGQHEHPIFSAHQMGGCALGRDPELSVVDLELRHRQVSNLFVVDGSVFPTALGVNPSETIYGLAHWARDHIAASV